jgi:hypothetical protein
MSVARLATRATDILWSCELEHQLEGELNQARVARVGDRSDTIPAISDKVQIRPLAWFYPVTALKRAGCPRTPNSKSHSEFALL